VRSASRVAANHANRQGSHISPNARLLNDQAKTLNDLCRWATVERIEDRSGTCKSGSGANGAAFRFHLRPTSVRVYNVNEASGV